ncbi:C4-dicarboxylate ABC transporter permease [Loktanella sp. IMCC34160]|uniref:TRAP transporter small permease subunit n=1 Tax=Loktanella sp. IMCC34160 TaxID=2510646 RepID=UPI00101DE1CF|nr:TRAP transporter small permease subunit [Loktanella sp. IMCC34160]RYG91960.1 C4-dicarboxylate ABC transporter permease [Loktanella sp. IMCC34160]
MGLVEAWGGNLLGWIVANLIESVYNLFYALTHPGLWLDWVTWNNTTEDKQSLMRLVYYGASVELFFVLAMLLIVYTAVAIWHRPLMWATVRGLEKFANTVGRTFAWAGLAMVLIQILIIFTQRIFAVAQITLGFGIAVSFDVSWWSESLKFYNAMVVALCATYTFVQGGHVRVDLVYSAVSFRTKKIIDMFGSLVFMIPAGVVIWMYSWFFFWRHMIVPNASASDALDRLVAKSAALRWNIETTGFSPNGFNAYFLFKVLILAYTGMILIHAVSFFYRSFLEWREGEASEGKYLDRDVLGDPTAERVAEIH